jgi:hypothetical protein
LAGDGSNRDKPRNVARVFIGEHRLNDCERYERGDNQAPSSLLDASADTRACLQLRAIFAQEQIRIKRRTRGTAGNLRFPNQQLCDS